MKTEECMIPPVLTLPAIAPRVKTDKLDSGGPFKLNLGGIGSGKEGMIPGFLVVDAQDTEDTDVVADCSKLTMFQDGSVSEIYASNILEHWPHTRTVTVLKEWRRVLAPKGILYISVPDMDANLRLYLEQGMTPWLINILWGDQVHPYAFHYINFSFASLAKACYDAGFSDILRLGKMPFNLPDASAHRDNLTFKPISLNVKVAR